MNPRIAGLNSPNAKCLKLKLPQQIRSKDLDLVFIDIDSAKIFLTLLLQVVKKSNIEEFMKKMEWAEIKSDSLDSSKLNTEFVDTEIEATVKANVEHRVEETVENNAIGVQDTGSIDLSVLDVADTLVSQGRYALAEEIYEQLRKSCISVYGEDDIKTLEVFSKIADLYRAQDRIDEAIELYSKVYQRQLELLGPKDEVTILTQQRLADLFYADGDLPGTNTLPCPINSPFTHRVIDSRYF